MNAQSALTLNGNSTADETNKAFRQFMVEYFGEGDLTDVWQEAFDAAYQWVDSLHPLLGAQITGICANNGKVFLTWADDSEESDDDTFDRKAFYRQHPELLGVLNPRFDDDETDTDDDAFGNLADYRYENAKDK